MTKKDYFIPRMFYRMLVPSVISSFGYALADMADALVVGNKLGEVGLAAISLCLPIFMLINLFMDGFGIGGSVLFSQKLGEGNIEEARDCFNRIWIATLTFGIIIGVGINIFADSCLNLLGANTADGEVYYVCRDYLRIIALGAPAMMLNIVFAGFLRNDNNAKLASAGFLIGNITDIVLNIVMVLIFDMGTKGAALSTVIGSLVAISVYLPGIIGNKADTLKVQGFKLNLGETFDCFKTGFATSVRHILQLVFFLVINRLLMTKTGENGVAVFDLVYNVSFFIIYLYNGIAEASQPLVSTFTGENNETDCKYILKLSKITAIALGTVITALIVFNAESISGFFGISKGLISASGAALKIYCIGFVFLGFNIINEKYYQSKDVFLPPFMIVLMREILIIIPCAIILARLNFSAIWFMYPITELITYLCFMFLCHFITKTENDFDENRILRITIGNTTEDIENALNRSSEFCKRWKANPEQEYAVTLVIEEICMSIIRNAMKDVSDGKIRITLLVLENGDFSLNILDNAVEFNPFSFRSGKIKTENDFDIDEISMTMIKNKTKKFMYRKCSGFNSLAVQI